MGRKLFVILSLSIFIFASLLMPTASARNQVTVFAASSLTESFTQLAKRFERVHPGVKIIFSFQASSTLATQIKAGAPADIFVSASPADMDGIAKGRAYLVNRVVLAVPKDSKISRVSELASASEKLLWIQCAPEVPCGKAANLALKAEAVDAKPASLEPKAASVLAKLLSGDVDAAIVYRSDVVTHNDKLKAIEFKDRKAASTTYKIAQLRKNQWASTFMSYLNSRPALKYLKSRGFE